MTYDKTWPPRSARMLLETFLPTNACRLRVFQEFLAPHSLTRGPSLWLLHDAGGRLCRHVLRAAGQELREMFEVLLLLLALGERSVSGRDKTDKGKPEVYRGSRPRPAASTSASNYQPVRPISPRPSSSSTTPAPPPSILVSSFKTIVLVTQHDARRLEDGRSLSCDVVGP
jgi:hypothetical protein